MLCYYVGFTLKSSELQTEKGLQSFRTILFKGTFKNAGVRRNQESTKVTCQFQQIRMAPCLCH